MHLDTIVIDDLDLPLEDAADTLRFHVADLRFHVADLDDAADTQRFRPDEIPMDPDATSTYDLRETTQPTYVGRARVSARRRLIHATMQEVASMRAAVAAGWDVGPELAYGEKQLAALRANNEREEMQ